MTMTAPFNFVPFSDTVYCPSWSEKISHDVPFKDGKSGVIDITITAKSPIFISDGLSKKGDSKAVKQFCQHNNRYFLPATSVAGMIRNVLEILSFSRCSQLDNTTYSFRDISNKALYLDNMEVDKIQCGWLSKKGKEYFIEDCGTPWRIRHEEIDTAFGLKNKQFSRNFKAGFYTKSCKDACYKYKLLAEICGMKNMDDQTLSKRFSVKYKDFKREIARWDPSGELGTIVFTGQPSEREEKEEGKEAKGKVWEFFFRNGSGKKYHLSKSVVENFLFAYFDGRLTQPRESVDWTFWKKKLNEGKRVPVFFQMRGTEVAHFGLSYMYKLPYKHSVHDGLPDKHRRENAPFDLTQSIMGTVAGQGLKARVQFSHFHAENNHVKPLPPVAEILGSPKASYYPIYISQNGQPYQTYMDKYFRLAGWKRYPVHREANPVKTTDTGNDDIKTKFRPLPVGTVFKGKLRYHNMKTVELGALLSALSFHGTRECYHQIGMAKALGYGKISLDFTTSEIDEPACLKAFEIEMNKALNTLWGESEQVKELLTMATEQNNKGNSLLRYMKLKDFAGKKRSKSYLKPYSKLNGVTPTLPALQITKEEFDELIQQQKEQAKQARQDAEKKKREEAEKRKQQEKEEKEKQKKLREEGLREYHERIENLSGEEKLIAQLESEYEQNKESIAHNAYALLEKQGFDLSDKGRQLVLLIDEQFKHYKKVTGKKAKKKPKERKKYEKRLKIEALSKQIKESGA